MLSPYHGGVRNQHNVLLSTKYLITFQVKILDPVLLFRYYFPCDEQKLLGRYPMMKINILLFSKIREKHCG